MNAHEDGVAETERVKERQRGRVERRAGDDEENRMIYFFIYLHWQ